MSESSSSSSSSEKENVKSNAKANNNDNDNDNDSKQTKSDNNDNSNNKSNDNDDDNQRAAATPKTKKVVTRRARGQTYSYKLCPPPLFSKDVVTSTPMTIVENKRKIGSTFAAKPLRKKSIAHCQLCNALNPFVTITVTLNGDESVKHVCKKCAMQQQEYCETVDIDNKDGKLGFLEIARKWADLADNVKRTPATASATTTTTETSAATNDNEPTSTTAPKKKRKKRANTTND